MPSTRAGAKWREHNKPAEDQKPEQQNRPQSRRRNSIFGMAPR
jgi:hypothetical protein